jgi:filamentous hemagglutinin family protein
MKIKLIKSNFYKNFLLLNSWIVSAAIIAFFNENTLAQQSNIVPDNTLDNEKSVVNPNFNNSPIEVVTGGAQRGQNLFHSFKEFNVSEGRGAYFYIPNANIANILTRVTGKNPSEIMGTLGTFGLSQPNLFLINPNGIIFGRNASLDVGGSFVATTANAIRLGERGFFSASEPQTSNLLSIQPSAFFFNALNRQAAIVNRSTATNPVLGVFFNGTPSLPEGATVRGLQVSDGKSMLLVGGDVKLEAEGKLSAYGGRIELGGLVSAGEVGLVINGDTLSLQFPNNIPLSNVSLLDDGRANVIGSGGGSIVVNANLFTATNGGLLSAGTERSRDAGDIIINANNVRISGKGYASSGLYNQNLSENSGDTGNISVFVTDSIELANGVIQTYSEPGTGDTGNITIRAKNAIALEQSTIGSLSTSGGDSGNIIVQSDGAIAFARSHIFSGNTGEGNAGNVTIQAKKAIAFEGQESGIFSNGFGGGDAGNINIQSDGSIAFDSNIISSGTSGEGKPGQLIIKANDSVTLINTNIVSSPLADRKGTSGDVRIQSGDFVILRGGGIISGTIQDGDAGDIDIQANGTVTIDRVILTTGVSPGAAGKGGNININAGSLSLTNGALLGADTAGEGNAGNINANIDGSLIASGGSRLGSSTFGRGNAGNITIQTGDTISFDGVQSNQITGGVYTFVGNDRGLIGQGRSGDITLKGQSISLTNRASLNSSSLGIGNAGNILIQASDSINLSNGSLLATATAGQGNAGNVTIDAPNAVISINGAVGLATGINSSVAQISGATGEGRGGDITIKARSLSLTNRASLFSSTQGRGNAGNIFVETRDSVSLDNSGILAPIFDTGIGKGGNIIIKTPLLSLTDISQVTTTTDGQGNAGNILIQASDSVNLSGGSQLRSGTSGVGNAGSVTINASNADVSFDGLAIINDRPAPNSSSGINTVVELVSGLEKERRGGDIIIKARSLSLSDRAELSSSTFGRGNAGNIFVETSDSVSLDNSSIFATVGRSGIGQGGDIDIKARSLSLDDDAALSVDTFGRGNTGNIDLQIRDSVILDRSSNIFSTVREGGIGIGGNINVRSRSLTLTDGSQLAASLFRSQNGLPGGQGRAGNINVNVTDFINLSGISSEGFSSGFLASTERGASGRGGNITVKTNTLHVADGATIDAFTANDSNAGTIAIAANTFILRDGATIRANSLGTGEGGEIRLQADSLTLDRDASISAQTASNTGGNINLQINDLLLLRNNSQISTTAGTAQASGNGGNIDINAKFIIANPNEDSDITANAFEGRGGRINLTAQGIFGLQDRNDNTNFSDITASSQLGIDGVIQIDTPDTDPSQGIVNLPSNVVDASELIDQRCLGGGATASQQGEFVITGRGGIPANPREPLPGEAVLSAEWLTLDTEAESNAEAETSSQSESVSSQPIIEAQGWVVDRDGKIILTAQVPTATPNGSGFAPHSCPVEVTQ